MVQYSFSGAGFNTAALIVPDLYIAATNPTILTINGVPTNICGVVGTAPYGPVNFPTVIGTAANYAANFGNVMPRKYDAGTHVTTALQNGCTAFVIVRVTDGTDTAATAASQTNNAVVSPSFVAPYTGSGGAGTQVMIAPGRLAGSWAATCSRPGRLLERFDNNFTTWQQIITAINTGIPSLNIPQSALVVAVTGSATLAGVPSSMTFTLAGGADGAGVSPAALVGVDGLTPTGAFGLRGQGCSVALCADLDTTSYWPTLDILGESEGIYFQHCYPSSTTLSTATTTQPTLGLSAYSKTLHGDWLYWYDTVNSQVRIVSPQGFAAGKLAALGPQQSGLNQQISGIIGSQNTGQNGGNAYSVAQLQALFQLNIDLITNPVPGGSYWAIRLGHNASTNPANWGDNYPRMTSFLARSMGAGMGRYDGVPITATVLSNIRATLLSFLSTLIGQGILFLQVNGSLPYSVVCDSTNNPKSRTDVGYVQADVQVQYGAILEKLIVNLQGGQGVTISTQSGS